MFLLKISMAIMSHRWVLLDVQNIFTNSIDIPFVNLGNLIIYFNWFCFAP
jgi:ammonia channel protein AmtB